MEELVSAHFEISPNRIAMHHEDGTGTVYAEGMADQPPPAPCQCDSCAELAQLRALAAAVADWIDPDQSDDDGALTASVYDAYAVWEAAR